MSRPRRTARRRAQVRLRAADNAVVASEPRGELAHTLTIASLERGAACDRVTLRDWTHEAAPAAGVLTLRVAVVRELAVRQDGATLVGC